MEKDRGGRIIALAALLIGVLGLSLGFAAFSSRLDITNATNVQIDDSTWEVGFSTVGTAITPGDVVGKTNGNDNGTLDLTQFIIGQKASANATLETRNGSKVEYSFFIVNTGKLNAYLNAVTLGSLSCAYVESGTERTTDDGHTTINPSGTGTITAEDCAALFEATLTIDSTDYTISANSGFGTTNQLQAPVSPATATNVPAKLTIAYKDNGLSNVTAAPNGDFVVSLGASSVVYGTSQVS